MTKETKKARVQFEITVTHELEIELTSQEIENIRKDVFLGFDKPSFHQKIHEKMNTCTEVHQSKEIENLIVIED